MHGYCNGDNHITPANLLGGNADDYIRFLQNAYQAAQQNTPDDDSQSMVSDELPDDTFNESSDDTSNESLDGVSSESSRMDASPSSDDIYVPENMRSIFTRQHIMIRSQVCIVCHEATDNRIIQSCNSGCTYYCHDVCAGRWIMARLISNVYPYCMLCGTQHNKNQIPLIVSDNNLINVVRLMRDEGVLGLGLGLGLGPTGQTLTTDEYIEQMPLAFREYIEFRACTSSFMDAITNTVMDGMADLCLCP